MVLLTSNISCLHSGVIRKTLSLSGMKEDSGNAGRIRHTALEVPDRAAVWHNGILHS